MCQNKHKKPKACSYLCYMLPGPPPSSGSHLSSLALNSHHNKLNFLSARIAKVCHQEQTLFYFSKKGNWHLQEKVRYRKVWCSKSTEIGLTYSFVKTVHYWYHRVSHSKHCVAQAPFLYQGQTALPHALRENHSSPGTQWCLDSRKTHSHGDSLEAMTQGSSWPQPRDTGKCVL